MSDGPYGDGEGDGEDTGAHIAVIGMACRFPGADGLDAFWRNLTDGVDTVTRSAPRPVQGGSTGSTGSTGPAREYVPARGLLKDPEWFDAGYFGYSPREARIIGPQHRVFLECAVEALDHAGYDPERHPGSIGVYGGGTDTSYAQLLRRPGSVPAATDMEILLGNAVDYLATRVAYKLGLRGPAVTVQAACATSLAAVHTAVQALLAGDCDLALAGGVAVHAPAKTSPYVEGGIIAADGVCRTFDAAAGGTVGGDGAGIVVLKRLAEALADGDHVHAVLRGTAVNNDGSDRIGFTAPSVEGQAAVIRDAQYVAGVDPGTVTYVEAHGTATPLGDPIEIAALTKAFGKGAEGREVCRIGSVKTNIGHTDAAAGAAGLIKTVLALEHATIPRSLHFDEPNPRIDFGAGPFRVATRTEEWRPRGMPRRAGVSSFGIGGTNAHVVLEEAPAPVAADPADPWQLLVLSARTPAALGAVTENLAAHLRAHPELPVADIAWTLQSGRRVHAHRAYAVVSGREDTLRVLSGEDGARLAGSPGTSGARPVTFLFPGTGALGEVHRLYAAEQAFCRAVEECHAAAAPHLGASATEALRRGEGHGDPLLADLTAFAEEYALAHLWSTWGIRPATVLGTGVGALTAATVAGALDLDGALRLVLGRARLLNGADAASAPDGPSAPGTESADRFQELVREAGPRAPRIPVACAVSGRLLAPDEVVERARWSVTPAEERNTEAALAALLAEPHAVLVEIGAGATLTSLARRSPGRTDTHVLIPTLTGTGGTDEPPSLLTALGDLWLAGAAVSWDAVHGDRRRLRVPLPAYPFERQRHLVELAEPDPLPAEPGSLPAAEGGSGSGGGPVREETSLVVARLYAEILGLPEVGPDDSFFDLGGDSLIAVQLLTRTRELFAVDLDVLSLYEAETAAQLAELIDKSTADGDSSR
ncbi:type I polyketide synthase [Streptomyces sp. NPDC096310]|uniref:type I polyketide synthase n=1 Tax=Streptomyces sp. NPDC096310 TaxID=3366082 RepID=UPI003803200F